MFQTLVFKFFILISLIFFNACSLKSVLPEKKDISFTIPMLEVHGKAPFFSISSNKDVIVGAFFVKKSKLYGKIYVKNHKSQQLDIIDCKTGSKNLTADLKYNEDKWESYFLLKNSTFCYEVND